MARLKVAWFDCWHPDLDAALATLPLPASCPTGLYPELVERSTGDRRVALVTCAGSPVAVAALRRLGLSRVEPLTSWIIPGWVVPCATGSLFSSLRSLPVATRVAWWRVDGPIDGMAFNVATHPVHRIPVADRERYWKSTHKWRDVKHARNKCVDLELTVDEPGAGEQIVRGWEQRWRARNGPTATLDDHVIAYRQLEEAGLLASVLLRDDQGVVGGATAIRDGDTFVAGVMFDGERSPRSIGTRLIDAMMERTEAEGATTFDLGGDHAYKLGWAPVSGTKSTFTVAPPHLRAAQRIAALAQRGLGLGRRLGATARRS